jgi:D-3-phosphoglycerate dehydrogenase / 2-oxoglutarate reductase
MTPVPKILLLEPLYHPSGEELLCAHAEVTVLRKPAHAEVVAAAASANAICPRYPNRVDRDVIAAARDLVVVSTSGRGTDGVDIEAATEHGVIVTNNPGFGRIPVSEHALSMLLALSRHLFEHDRMTRTARGWQDRMQAHNTIIDLEGRTLGIVGLGEIGREMARKCIAAFNMRALAYDPYVSAETAAAMDVALLPKLEDLLCASDYVSVHAELNTETRGMIDETALRAMQPHACLINTARGKIVQQAALLRALTEGWIRGAALDVFEDEPVGDGNPLAALPNIILTPHIGGVSESFIKGGAMATARKVLMALAGERPPDVLNEAAWERAKQRAARIARGG